MVRVCPAHHGCGQRHKLAMELCSVCAWPMMSEQVKE